MQKPEEEDVIIFENVCEINYYKYDRVCVLYIHIYIYICVFVCVCVCRFAYNETDVTMSVVILYSYVE